MQLSQRISRLAPSPTVALNAKAKKLAATGVKVFNFSVGEPDSDTPKEIVDAAIAALNEGRTRYGPPGGTLELREAICEKLLTDNGLTYEPDQIVCGIGAKEILFHLSLALLNENDEAIIPAPYWVSYTTQVEAAGATPIIVPMDEEIGRSDLKKVAAAINDKTRLLILNSPNNPSGFIFNDEELKTIADMVKGKPIWVICDEMYEYLNYDRKHVSLLEVAPDLKDQFILVNGMSKGFAMTGWRVGYCAAPPMVAKLVKTLQSQSSTCLPGFIEKASVHALKNRTAITPQLRDAMQKKRDFVKDLFKDCNECHLLPSEGAFYYFIDVRESVRNATKLAEKSSMGLGEYLIEKYQVAMVPGEAFGAPGYMRLSYATGLDDLTEGLSRFKKALKEI